MADLAYVAALAGDGAHAEENLVEAIAIDPSFTAGYVNLADLYRNQQRDEEAERVLRRGLERAADRSRLLLQPVTGRSHQLRIHLRELGHPILGCDMYAHPHALGMAQRLLLHATTLAFEHPRTGERIEGHSPADF